MLIKLSALIILLFTLRCDIASSEMQPYRAITIDSRSNQVMYIFEQSKYLIERGQNMARYRKGEARLADCIPAQESYRRAAMILIRWSDTLGAGYSELQVLPRIAYNCLSCSDESAEEACRRAIELLEQVCN